MTTVNNQNLIEKFEEIDDNVTVLKDGVYSLRRDVSEIKENMVTKDFLRKELSKYPDKEYLDKKLENYPTKAYLDDRLKVFATKDDLKQFTTKDDLKGFITKDDLRPFITKDDLSMALKDQSESIVGGIKEVIRDLKRA